MSDELIGVFLTGALSDGTSGNYVTCVLQLTTETGVRDLDGDQNLFEKPGLHWKTQARSM